MFFIQSEETPSMSVLKIHGVEFVQSLSYPFPLLQLLDGNMMRWLGNSCLLLYYQISLLAVTIHINFVCVFHDVAYSLSVW